MENTQKSEIIGVIGIVNAVNSDGSLSSGYVRQEIFNGGCRPGSSTRRADAISGERCHNFVEAQAISLHIADHLAPPVRRRRQRSPQRLRQRIQRLTLRWEWGRRDSRLASRRAPWQRRGRLSRGRRYWFVDSDVSASVSRVRLHETG